LARYKKQHYVPQSYLKAWCDPATPEGQEPYVWVFSKDGSSSQRKAPSNIFCETDLYTIHLDDGGRDLVFERGLSQLESEFARVRGPRTGAPRPLDRYDLVCLVAFAAAMHLRSPAMARHWTNQLNSALAMGDEMREWAKKATPAQLAAMSSPSGAKSGDSISYEELKEAAENPFQKLLLPQLASMTEELLRLDMVMLTASQNSRFITSDFPCVWFDPQAYKRPPFYRSPALVYPTIEITLPVSPSQMLLLNRQGVRGTVGVTDDLVDEYNRRTRFHCVDHFVNFENSTNPAWFDAGVAPPDAWQSGRDGGTEQED